MRSSFNVRLGYSHKNDESFPYVKTRHNSKEIHKNLSRKGRPRSGREFLLETCQEEEEAPCAWHSVGYA